jgi:WD40 repeat protein
MISAKVLGLARRVLKILLLSKPKLAATILAIGLFAASAGLLALPKESEKSLDDRQTSVGVQKTLPPEKEKLREAVDQFGDALPPGALARLGTIRWRLEPDGANCMAFSKDGKTLLTGNSDTGVTAWEMQTGKILRRLPEKPELRKAWLGYDTVVALSADGRTAAFGVQDGTVHLVDFETGKSLLECRGHSGRIQVAALSADGKVLASRSSDKTLRVWQTQTGKELRQLPIHELERDVPPPAEMALSMDAKLLAWVGPIEKRSIHIFDIEKNRETANWDVSAQFRCFISFSPDGTKLVSTGDGGPSQVWDVATGKELRQVPAWRKGFIPSATFGPDSKVLLHTLGGQKMALFDVSTGGEIWQHPRQTSSTKLDVVAFTPDGKSVVIARGDSQILHQFDLTTGKRLLPADDSQDGFRAIAFARDEMTLLTTGTDGVLRTWDSRSGKENLHSSIDSSGWCVFSRNGKRLALTKEGRVCVLDTVSGMETNRLGKHSKDWHHLQFSADGKLLLDYGTSAGTLIWDLTSPAEPLRIETPKNGTLCLAFSPDSRSLIGHHYLDEKNSGDLVVWDLATGRVRQKAPLPPSFAFEVVLSPDGKGIVLCGDQFHRSAIFICEISTGAKRMEIKRDHYVFPPSLRFSPDGLALIVNGGPNASAEVYDAFTGHLLNRQEGHRGCIGSVAFSPSGKVVATTSTDTTALVWDAASFLRTDKRQTLKLTSDELNGLWSDLAGDSEKSYQAMDKMIRSPQSSVDYLSKRFNPVPITDEKDLAHVDQLVQELDSETFTVRENATLGLEKLGPAAAPALRKALGKTPSAEVSRRLEQLLAKIDGLGQSGEFLRDLRSLEVLEYIASDQAKNFLEKLGKGAPEARLTKDAQASLARLLNKGK